MTTVTTHNILRIFKQPNNIVDNKQQETKQPTNPIMMLMKTTTTRMLLRGGRRRIRGSATTAATNIQAVRTIAVSSSSSSSSSSSFAHHQLLGNCCQLQAARTITSSLSSSSSRSLDQRQRENSLDKFTHFALNPTSIPLGAMADEVFDDMLDAIEAWLELPGGGGFAIDSAERLLERVVVEHAASSSKKTLIAASARSRLLWTLQRQILNSWIDAFHGSGGRSMMALSRGEASLSYLIRLPSTFLLDSFSDGTTTKKKSMFPLEEYFLIVEGYLNVRLATQAQTGTEKAARLLLNLITLDNTEGKNNTNSAVENMEVDLTDYAEQVGALFEKCATKLWTIDSRNKGLIKQVLQTMIGIKESRLCPELKIPTPTHSGARE